MFFRHPEISFFHLSTDKSTGKDYLSGARNVHLGQHRQLISPPLLLCHKVKTGRQSNLMQCYASIITEKGAGGAQTHDPQVLSL